MYTAPTAPRSIGGVLDDAITLYVASFRRWWLPSLLMALMGPLLALAMFSRGGIIAGPAGLLTGTASREQMAQLLSAPGIWIGYLVMMLLQVYFYAVIFGIAVAVQRGQAPTAAASLGNGLRTFPASLLAAFLLLLIFVGLGAVVVLPTTLLANFLPALTRQALIFGVLFVAMVFVFGRVQYAAVAIQAERAGGRASLNQSWALSRGYWWRGAVILTVAVVILMVLSAVISIVVGAFAALARTDMVVLLIVSQGLAAALNVLIIPLLPVVLTATYFDIKLRKDGGDLAARVGGLQRA